MSNVLNYILFHFYSTFAPLFSSFSFLFFCLMAQNIKKTTQHAENFFSDSLARLLEKYIVMEVRW